MVICYVKTDQWRGRLNEQETSQQCLGEFESRLVMLKLLQISKGKENMLEHSGLVVSTVKSKLKNFVINVILVL